MNKYIQRYFEGAGDDHFHRVVAVNGDVSWEKVHEIASHTPRGWFELTRLDPESRIEFVQQFWLSKLDEHPLVEPFFDRLDDILLYLVQARGEESFSPWLVYSLKDDEGFFQGSPPMSDVVIENHSLFRGEPLPSDYLAFEHIHGSFKKNEDSGIYSIQKIKEAWELLQSFLEKREPLLFYNGEEVDGKKLIPFYNSFGRYSWQCFCADWYPEEEMGNIAVSYETVFLPTLKTAAVEGLAFMTFIDWLVFYLKPVEEV